MTIDQNKTYTATIVTTDGSMTATLFAKEDPVTVNNFVFLANDGYYNGVIFHRIIKDFMVQTGDPLGTGRGDPGYQFKDEPVTRKYVRGTLAMANSGPNTNGSQFFIVTKDSPQLPPNYTIFGMLTGDQSFATLDALANTPVTQQTPGGEQSKPVNPPKIVTVSISA